MPPASSTALSQVMSGEKKVNKTAVPGALKEAASKLEALRNRFATAKENASATAMSGVHVLETVTVLGAAGAAEGYFGEEKMKLGPVPMRAAGGLVLTGWGLASQLSGGNGGHQLAIGVGLMGADAYSMGRQAGVALREKYAAAANPPPTAPQGTAAQQALIAANPGAKLVAGKVIAANGSALEGDDLGDLARLVRLQAGTAGDRERAMVPRNAPAGAARRASRA